ncbi:PleD family two-component system response regulator [Anaerovibrio sp.]|uniref:response regulator n=1 Tax=Anaerovibrio sp. TaxID=1872532 RepID=UPI0038900172
MDMKILVTGRNKEIATDVCKHLRVDRGDQPVKCNPVRRILFEVILAEIPKVIIICLRDETKDTVQQYNILQDAVRRGLCKVIVITSGRDEKTFVKHTKLGRVQFLSRPVSLFALFEILKTTEEELDTQQASYREYVNDAGLRADNRKTVLVVDDDTEQLLHIKDQLEEFYNVAPVKSGSAAFKYLEKHKPDIILLDYLMPEQDGAEVLSEMRQNDDYKDIPVIFLTGVSEKETVIKLLSEFKPQGYIVKPSKKSEIVAKIIDVLG